MAEGRVGPNKTPVYLNFEGNKTADKQEWKERFRKWGEGKYGDRENGTEIQKERILNLGGGANGDVMDGRARMKIKFADTCQARASIKTGKAAGGGRRSA